MKLWLKTNCSAVKRLCLILIVLTLFLSACANNTPAVQEESYASSDTNSQDTNTYKEDAYALLSEWNSDQRITDFLSAYEMLQSLPSNPTKFIEELKNIQGICSRYNIELKYLDYFIEADQYDSLRDNEMREYIMPGSEPRNDDTVALINSLIYPVILEKFGDDVQALPHIKAAQLHDYFSLNGYNQMEKQNISFDTTFEEWKDAHGNKATITYHKNDLIKKFSYPIVHHSTRLTEEEYKAYFNLPLEQQKAFAEQRFMALLSSLQLNDFTTDIFQSVFTKEQLTVLYNYIRSLDAEKIWELDIIGYGETTRSVYSAATLSIVYNNISVSLEFTMNQISLELLARNQINDVSQRYYTVLCGLVDDKDTVDFYDDFINSDVSKNEEIYEYQIDLTSMEAEYQYAAQEEYANISQPSVTLAPVESILITPTFTNELGITCGGYYTLKLPSSWTGKYMLDIGSFGTNAYDTSFYYKESKFSDCALIFGLYLYDDTIDYRQISRPGLTVLGHLEVYRIGSYWLVLDIPTETQAPPEFEDEYNQLINDVSAVIDSMTFSEEATFSPNGTDAFHQIANFLETAGYFETP